MGEREFDDLEGQAWDAELRDRRNACDCIPPILEPTVI